ncbi:hypothetical protein DL95DRAFT_396015 [Leptodontidium sp. 2 PMI_412]|nr:hypothetical protein DL95DRAFT_396015 [Leptodontidium sp. 2 PMI_412]
MSLVLGLWYTPCQCTVRPSSAEIRRSRVCIQVQWNLLKDLCFTNILFLTISIPNILLCTSCPYCMNVTTLLS